MGSSDTKASLASANESAAGEKLEREPSPPASEGVGVFRALLVMALSYLVFGLAIWFVWRAFQHWRRG